MPPLFSGLYYKNIKTVNGTSRVIRITIISDGPSCGITYSHSSDDSRGVIYTFRVINYTLREQS